MERNASSTGALLSEIKDLSRSLVKELSEGRSPTIFIHKFRNYCTNPNSNCLCSSDLPKGQLVLTLTRQCHASRIDVLLRVLVIVQQLLLENRHGSKRDIYYMHPSLFSEQSVVDRAINDICILLQCSRHNLNVVSVGKGLVMGWLQFLEAGRKFDCISSPTTAYHIPVNVEEVKDIVSVAKYILIVEKESVFQRLANDKFCNANRCIVITGRGYPDIPTRRFLRLLVEKLCLPVYCLVDCDPYGFDILTTYRFGSMQMAYDAKFLRVPEVQWLGAFPSDFEKYDLPQQCLLPLTAEDKRRTETMLLRCYLQKEVPEWRLELELMLQKGVKFEIEALSVHTISFLSEQYIPSKIQKVKSCKLRVNVHCDGCKRKIMEVLQNLKGVYSVVLDAEQGNVKVNGKVNPTTILNVFDKYGKHGEVSFVRFDGEVMERIPYSFYGENPYIPYEVPCPSIPHPFFGAAEQQLYGRNQYLMSMPPPLPGPMPPPPPPQQQQQPPPSPPPPVSKDPSAPPAAPPPYPKCCTIM